MFTSLLCIAEIFWWYFCMKISKNVHDISFDSYAVTFFFCSCISVKRRIKCMGQLGADISNLCNYLPDIIRPQVQMLYKNRRLIVDLHFKFNFGICALNAKLLSLYLFHKWSRFDQKIRWNDDDKKWSNLMGSKFSFFCKLEIAVSLNKYRTVKEMMNFLQTNLDVRWRAFWRV